MGPYGPNWPQIGPKIAKKIRLWGIPIGPFGGGGVSKASTTNGRPLQIHLSYQPLGLDPLLYVTLLQTLGIVAVDYEYQACTATQTVLMIDTLFSEKKFINCKIIKNGGWHFTNIKTAEEIKYKLKSYLHHIEFDKNPLTANQINEIINDKVAIYDLSVDQRNNKLGGNKLENYPIQNLPKFLIDNLEKYKEWID